MPQTSPMNWMCISLMAMSMTTMMTMKKVMAPSMTPMFSSSFKLKKAKKWTW